MKMLTAPIRSGLRVIAHALGLSYAVKHTVNIRQVHDRDFAMVKLAFMSRYLRLLKPSDTT